VSKQKKVEEQYSKEVDQKEWEWKDQQEAKSHLGKDQEKEHRGDRLKRRNQIRILQIEGREESQNEDLHEPYVYENL